MKHLIDTTVSQRNPIRKNLACLLAATALTAAFTAGAANINWQGGTASYNTPADWVGGVVPGLLDNAINDNGTNNAVQINLGNPDWSVNQIRAGNSAGNGAFVQNGQNVTLTGTNFNSSVLSGYITPFRLGVTAGDIGVYTLNGGSINYSNGAFNIGELGTGILNIGGGSIVGSGNFADNSGTLGTPTAVTATVGGGLSEGDFTWFEQGYYTPNVAIGLPPAGTTITSTSQADHSYNMPPSYTANNAVLVSTNLPSATITLTPSTLCSGLSFLCSAGNGPVTNNYTVHHADSSIETGSIIIPDWFGPGSASEVLAVAGRVDALGVTIQLPNNVTPYTGNAPYLWSLDIALANTTSPVTSIDLAYAGGGVATFMGVSTQATVGGAFTPVSISGFNEDVVVEAGAQSYVSGSVTDVVNQTNGAVTVNGGGQLFIGNVGTGIYNLSGGSVDVHNYIGIGRSSGNGTLNMTGGTLNQDGGGNILVGTGFNNNGNAATGVLNQSGGTINDQGQFLCPENSPSSGTYNLSGTGALIVNNWLVFGRGGAAGVLNMTGGSILQTNSGGNFEVGEGTSGTINQSGGSVATYNELWIGQAGGAVGVYNLSGTGTLTANSWLAIGRQSGNGTLNLTNGVVAKIGGSGNHFDVGAGGQGALNQYGGLITNTTSDFWLGESAAATWNFNGGMAVLGNLVMCVNNSASATLNLNGGVLQASSITSPTTGSTVSMLNLNSGTVQANANNTAFISGLFQAAVGSPGVTIDSQGFNITIPQVLVDNGGGTLTKIGSGTLTLSGGNSYAGSTVINAGKLITGTSSTTTGGYTVADGAGFGVLVQTAGALYNASSLALGTSAGASLDFNLGPFGNPTSAPLIVGSYTANGTITINISATVLAAGTIPLLQYSSLTGSPTYAMGSLPPGVVAHLATAGNIVQLVVTSAGAPRWDGNVTGAWDLGTNQDWFDLGTMALTTYRDGLPVIFDDNAAGTTTVNLTATVSPASIIFTNSILPYSIVGTGKISGSTGLSVSGLSTVAVLNTGGNNYTGATVINSGTLTVTNLANGGSASAIGASAATPSNLVLNGGTLDYEGPAVSINRGYSLTSTSTITDGGNLTLTGLAQASGVVSTLTKSGAGQLTYAGVGANVLSTGDANPGYQAVAGTVTFDGSAGAQTNIENGQLFVGSTPASGASLILTNTGLGCSDWFAVARGTGTSGYTSSASLYNTHMTAYNVSLGYANGISGNSAIGNLSLNGNSSLYNGGGVGFNLSESGGSTCTVTVADNSWIYSVNRILLALSSGATGNLIVKNNGAVTNAGYVSIGAPGVATATLQDNAVWRSPTDFNITDTAGSSASPSSGTLNISNNATLIISTLYVGKSAYCTGTINQSGGTVLNSGGGEWRIGGNISGATNQLGVWNFTGGNITVSDNFQVGAYGTGYFNQTGGSAFFTGGFPDIGRFPGGIGYVNLSGGSWNCVSANSRLLIGEQGTGTVNVSGTGAIYCGGNAGPGTAPDGNTGIIIGLTSTGIGTMNVTNGSVIITNDTCVARDAGSQGTLNLYGGVFATRALYKSTAGATGSVNFYGGTLRAMPAANNANFMNGLSSVTIYPGGATIDSGTNAITIAQNLNNGGGGLTKIGSGTLYLNGVNTYTGNTAVSVGTLAGTGSVTGAVTVASGATLAAGSSPSSIGTFTISNTLAFASGSTSWMKIGASSNDQIVGLTGVAYNGTLTVTNTTGSPLTVGNNYTLFKSSSAGSGNFAAVTILPSGFGTFNPSTGVLTITAGGGLKFNPVKVSSGNLILTGTGGTASSGYTLLTATNLMTPLSAWTTNTTGTLDGSGAFSNSVPVNSSQPAAFYRVRVP